MKFRSFLSIAGSLAYAVAVAQTSYAVRDLGVLPRTDSSLGVDVNDSGQVVGYTSLRGAYQHNFFWSASTGMVDMGFFDDVHLSNSGYVIGNRSNWVWKYGENGNARAYPPAFRPGGAATVSSVNDSGQVGGYSETSTIIGYVGTTPQYQFAPAIWNRVGGSWVPTQLPMPDGDTRALLHVLGNAAADGTQQAVGISAFVSYPGGVSTIGQIHCVRWVCSGGVWSVAALVNVDSTPSFNMMNARGDAAGTHFFDAATNSVSSLAEIDGGNEPGVNAAGIDASGNVCGTKTLQTGYQAVVRDPSTGVVSPLGTLGGVHSSATIDGFFHLSYRHMSASGQVVGVAETGSRTDAFIWSAGNGMLDLNSSALTPNKSGFAFFSAASAISGSGRIVGTGQLSKGKANHAFLLTPQ